MNAAQVAIGYWVEAITLAGYHPGTMLASVSQNVDLSGISAGGRPIQLR
jgi:hypothetical protein